MTDPPIETRLVDALDHVLEQLQDAIDERLVLARQDPVEGDRLFVLAGQIDAALLAASSHLRRVRDELEGVARERS